MMKMTIMMMVMMMMIRFVDMGFKHKQRQNDKRYLRGCTVTSFLKH